MGSALCVNRTTASSFTTNLFFPWEKHTCFKQALRPQQGGGRCYMQPIKLDTLMKKGLFFPGIPDGSGQKTSNCPILGRNHSTVTYLLQCWRLNKKSIFIHLSAYWHSFLISFPWDSPTFRLSIYPTQQSVRLHGESHREKCRLKWDSCNNPQQMQQSLKF